MIERGARSGSMKLWNRLKDEFGLSPDEIFELLKEAETETAWRESEEEAAQHDLSKLAKRLIRES